MEAGRVVVIGASAGGVAALSQLLADLTVPDDVAVFVVMHIPPHVESQLADILDLRARAPVEAAVDNATIVGGRVFVASADRHLVLEAGKMRLTRGPKECRARPSVDVLFRSAAVLYGSAVIGVVLTGALDDGTAGLWAIKENGGIAIVQDPGTAEHSSMPQSAMDHVAVDAVLPLERIGAELASSMMEPLPDRKALPTSTLQIETAVALEGNGLKAGVMRLGPISQYTCPDCHGVLVQIDEGRSVRFRCHTGHAFSSMTLLAEVNDAIDKGLWDTLRAIEERILLLEQFASMAHERGDSAAATALLAQAQAAKDRVESIRKLVLDPELFGHGANAI
jgi:two-component system chemotaxis response regulator CheB